MAKALHIVVIGRGAACERVVEKLHHALGNGVVRAIDPAHALDARASDLRVILIDHRHNGVLGLVRDLSRQQPRVSVLVHGEVADGGAVLDLVVAGAIGVLDPEMRSDQLADAVRKAAAGRPTFSGSSLDMLVRHLREQRAASADGLSEREHEVLGLVARGHTYKRIASQLSLSPFTVKNHVQNILRKLGVRTRMEAVQRVMRPR